jgi:sugar phosphate isomerase/epimerase
VALLGFESVDIGLFLKNRNEVRDFVSRQLAQTRALSNQLDATGLNIADLFLIVGGDKFAAGALNALDPDQRAELRRVFDATVRMCRDVELGGMSILPGVSWPERWQESWEIAAAELRWRVDRAASAGIELRIEPHIGSIVPIPELVSKLVEEVPGLRLTLDAGHFAFQAIELDRILPLARFAGHVHVSGARAGGIHVTWDDNEIDFERLVPAVEAAGFTGRYCIEYVPMSKWGANSTDVVGAVVELRDEMSRLVQA